jgi:hypothetical protein
MKEIKRMRHVLYDGTMESLQNMTKNLKLDYYDYDFNILTKKLYIRETGMIYQPGDYYQYAIDEEFEAI